SPRSAPLPLTYAGCSVFTAVPSLHACPHQASRRLVVAVRCTPVGLVERLASLHDVEQQRHELPRNGAHGTHPAAAVPRQQRFVLSAVESTLLAPAAREEEELTHQERPPALGLPRAAIDGEPRLIPFRQVHPGELQHLARRDVVVRVPRLGHNLSRYVWTMADHCTQIAAGSMNRRRFDTSGTVAGANGCQSAEPELLGRMSPVPLYPFIRMRS